MVNYSHVNKQRQSQVTQRVIYGCCRLSHRGMTIIMSIHQPRYSIFKLFDTMMLMSGGECVFYGAAQDGLQHFHSGSEFFSDQIHIRHSGSSFSNPNKINKHCCSKLSATRALLNANSILVSASSNFCHLGN